MKEKLKFCFLASEGGHLNQIKQLEGWAQNKGEIFYVTEKTQLTVEFGNSRKIYYLPHVNRFQLMAILKLCVIFVKSAYILLKERPNIVVSTGALATIPLCMLSKLFKVKLIFIESFSKVNDYTITGKLMYRISDLFIIQRESLFKFYPKATFGGPIF